MRLALRTGASARILAASRLIPLKRIDGLIRTVARIPKISLVLVGDGPEEHRLRRLAADLVVSERIAFMGPLSHGDTLSAIPIVASVAGTKLPI